MTISIITIVKNPNPLYFREMLQSVHHRNRFYEHIVVDDSDRSHCDDVVDVLRDFNVKFVRQKSKGLWSAFQEGFQVASGDILGVINSDDVVCDNIVGEIKQALVGRDFCYGNSLRIDRNGVPLYRHKPPHFLLPWLARFLTFSVSHHTVYFRREILDNIEFLDRRFNNHLDLVFIVRLFEEYRSQYLNKDISKFRITGCNASAGSYQSTAQVFGSLNSVSPQLYIVSKMICALFNPGYLTYLAKRQAGLYGLGGKI